MGWGWRDEATKAGLLDVYLGWASGASWELFRKETTREREVFYRGLARLAFERADCEAKFPPSALGSVSTR